MKKNILVLIAIMTAAGSLFAHQTNNSLSLRTDNIVTIISDSNSNILFRGTQKLRANDKSEIYLYSNGNVEMYNSNGRLVATGTYVWDGDSEVFIKDSDGNIIYKGRCSVNEQKQLVSLTLSGTTYWRKN